MSVLNAAELDTLTGLVLSYVNVTSIEKSKWRSKKQAPDQPDTPGATEDASPRELCHFPTTPGSRLWHCSTARWWHCRVCLGAWEQTLVHKSGSFQHACKDQRWCYHPKDSTAVKSPGSGGRRVQCGSRWGAFLLWDPSKPHFPHVMGSVVSSS